MRRLRRHRRNFSDHPETDTLQNFVAVKAGRLHDEPITPLVHQRAAASTDYVLLSDWPADGSWCLYLIECRNGSWYAGITNHLQARYATHVAGRGARYTRANPPQRLLGFRCYADRSAASKAEWAIKQLPKAQKLAFLQVAADRFTTTDESAPTA